MTQTAEFIQRMENDNEKVMALHMKARLTKLESLYRQKGKSRDAVKVYMKVHAKETKVICAFWRFLEDGQKDVH